MCNPWVFVLQDVKLNQEADTIPENLENLDEDDFIYGWLMFDLLYGFIPETKMTSRLKQCSNCYVWLLNMAASYQAALYEKTIINLDFFMHFHLQKSSINTWKHLFGKDNENWQHVPSDVNAHEDEMPSWFQ